MWVRTVSIPRTAASSGLSRARAQAQRAAISPFRDAQLSRLSTAPRTGYRTDGAPGVMTLLRSELSLQSSLVSRGLAVGGARGMAKKNRNRNDFFRSQSPNQSRGPPPQSQSRRQDQPQQPPQPPQPSQSRQSRPEAASLSKETSPTEQTPEASSSESSEAGPESPPEAPLNQAPKAPEPNEQAAAEPSDQPQSPLGSLPDLTQGIPSTYEFEQAQRSRSALTEVPDFDDSDPRSRRELPASAYVSSSDRRRQKLARYMMGFAAGTLVFAVVYLGRNWDEQERLQLADAPNGWGIGLWWKRLTTRLADTKRYYHDPAFDKLLPDPHPAYSRPYTLVISLEDLLAHDEWSREHGWRLAKRPGMDYFIRYLSQYYELVLFTSSPFATSEPTVRKIDPFHLLLPLFKEATKYKDGKIVKDLSYLNRDLSKVIIIDTNPEHVSAQPENAIVLPRWTGEVNDKELIALIPFLEFIHTVQSPDVRKVLKSFEGTHIPTEFSRREAMARREFQKKQMKQMKASDGGKPSGLAAVGAALGFKSPSSLWQGQVPEGEVDPVQAFAQGKMLQDIARERGQKNYEMLDKEIRENGEKWLAQEQAEQEKMQKEAMQGMMKSFWGWFLPGDNK